ncbi:uncharacterized protein STEHIDRAFT_157401 [Stereum hirsutum FP-91666 SS1]|uniref:uncharacterized protein n=1 Tax=Stereum hirsutum (strain FP-91666) TaxID=721885 RepID=UPI000444945F|nr:uncharacterized protein STEHIDRAFT_157401 [Stereum hirsutum FP-91666 SS1]EIM85867.1 hypothetical protein STEHIDRAFT_157401 [Stereum hirsutum FP-91666 SS1]
MHSQTLVRILAAMLPFISVASSSALSTDVTCPSNATNHLCCRTLAPFSDNAYVWENVCGITNVPSTTPTASFCSELETCPTGLLPVCCETLASCQSGVDGPIGLNCTQVEN